MTNKQLTFLVLGAVIALVGLGVFVDGADNIAEYVAAAVTMFFGMTMAVGGSQS